MNTFKYHYQYQIRKDLIMQYNYASFTDIPKLKTLILSVGTKETLLNKKKIIPSLLAVELLTGVTPLITRSKKAIANFNLKKNYPIGLKVTLTNTSMYNLLFKLTNAGLYLNKDFNGIPIKSFNNLFKLTFSIKDLSSFLEISNYYENFEFFQGLNISLVTRYKSLNEAKSLISGLRIPLIK